MLKYSKELLESVVKESVNLTQVLTKLGIKNYSGGMSNHISSRIQFFGIDTTHFLGKKTNSGLNHKGGIKKKTADEVLAENSITSHRTKTYQLRRALIEKGVPYICSSCSQIPTWNNKKLVLEIDHINRCRTDNGLSNLRFLCPNCHSQETAP